MGVITHVSIFKQYEMMLLICNLLIVVRGMIRRYAISACSDDDGLLENISSTWRPEHDFHGGTVSNEEYNEYLRRQSGKDKPPLIYTGIKKGVIIKEIFYEFLIY